MKQIKLYPVPLVLAAALLMAICDCGPGLAPAPSAEKALCADIKRRYDNILSSAGRTCRSDADCGCYGPVSRKSGCGGVTDKQSADHLRELAQKFRHGGCDFHIRCAAWFCNPVCERGRCIRGKQPR